MAGISGCQPTHNERVQKAVQEHLKTETPDSFPYNPESFGTLDSIYLPAKATDQYQQLSDTFKLSAEIYALRSKVKMAVTDAKRDSLKKELTLKQESLEKRKKLIADYLKDYEPRLVGYWQPHTYQVNDSTYQKAFRVDTGYQVVNSKPYTRPDSLMQKEQAS